MENDRKTAGVETVRKQYLALMSEIDKVVVGYDEAKRNMAWSLFGDQHVIFESVPGLAKTLLVECFQQAIGGARSSRIQFTPDLMPQDIVGYPMWDEATKTMKLEAGPIVGEIVEREGKLYGTVNIVLGDEINRTTPKTQSALLSPMQERKVVIGKKTIYLPGVFLVVATMNPIENEGTYPLPEAQLDRFGTKKNLSYVSFDDEMGIASNASLRKRNAQNVIQPVLSISDIENARAIIDGVYISDALRDYVVRLVRTTRPADEANGWSGAEFLAACAKPEGKVLKGNIGYGVSPRSINTFLTMGQVVAACNGRDYVLPEDIRAIASDVLSHRLVLSDDAVIDGVRARDLVAALVKCVPINEDVSLYQPK